MGSWGWDKCQRYAIRHQNAQEARRAIQRGGVMNGSLKASERRRERYRLFFCVSCGCLLWWQFLP